MIIKAGSVTNLTDARFFAAHEVDYIGFCFDPLSPYYISPQNALAIKGWISGPKIVAEFANQDIENIKNIIAFFEPDVIEIQITEFNNSDLDLPVIIKINGAEINDFNNEEFLFLLVDELMPQQIPELNDRLMITVNDLDLSLPENISAVQIKGGAEIEVGVKDYELLSDFLESLRH